MKKIIAVLAACVMATVLFAACAAGPEGDRVYALSSVEENDYGYTTDSFKTFNINLFEDGTYRVDFQAKGMPVVAKESGTYSITDGVLTLQKTSGSNLIDSIVSYDQKSGEIKALCKSSSDDGTYTAIFTKNDETPQETEDNTPGNGDNNPTPGENDNEDENDDQNLSEIFIQGTYSLIEIKDDEDDEIGSLIKSFTVVFEDGNYTASFSPNGAPMSLTETGTYIIDGNNLELLRAENSKNTVLVTVVGYDEELKQITIECKAMGAAPNYIAVFELQS